MFTSTEQAAAPGCGVCGRKLGVGYYYTCHVCNACYCYAHIPMKCPHEPVKKETRPSQLRITR